jgi:hypothetical protein
LAFSTNNDNDAFALRDIRKFRYFCRKIITMELENRIRAFARLGELLRQAFDEGKETAATASLLKTAEEAIHYNGWFTKDFVFHALAALGESLRREKLQKWVAAYPSLKKPIEKPKTIGVVMAGNVPAVGFHDFLSVLISGHRIQARLSSDDNKLLPAIARVLTTIEPGFEPFIAFTEKTLHDFDAIIATGSNNTSRYFDYYFGKYPHIIRKNRNGVAVLTGKEPEAQLQALAHDVFLYYGLGCRNVAKLFVPENYDFNPLLKTFEGWKKVNENHKYFNNYEYNKAIFLVNHRAHFDTGNLLLVEDEKFVSPVGVLYYEFYSDPVILRNRLTVNSGQIQCIVTESDDFQQTVALGKSQSPELWEYADGVDTLQFLLSL